MSKLSKLSLALLATLITLMFPVYAGTVNLGGGFSGGNFSINVSSIKEQRFKTIYKQQYDFSCGSATLASLLSFHYDDVVDESNMRRGRETANALFGNSASVLVGDFLYSRSFQMMSELNNLKIMDILSDATNIIAEGEVLQLMNCNDPDTTEESYMQVIYCKTAKLFEAATRLAAVIAKKDQVIELAMLNYGKHLGTAFQLVDDIMDYTADAQEMGKNVGDDLAEGKPTLPLLYAMKHGNEQQQTMIRSAIENGDGMDHLDDILMAMKQTGSLVYTQKKAELEADKAINAIAVLPESEHKQALIALAHIAANRSH